MTGRKGRVVRRPDGRVQYESRAEQGFTIDNVNINEKERFMEGKKVKIQLMQTPSIALEPFSIGSHIKCGLAGSK